jgi:hypothetical protein
MWCRWCGRENHCLSAFLGPPGAGKSFGVKQIANEIFGKSAWLEFNLSQFADSDLIGALHQVRDKVLEVGIPVVFWDEFDARQYHWLQYLLAPMQDGRFQEGATQPSYWPMYIHLRRSNEPYVSTVRSASPNGHFIDRAERGMEQVRPCQGARFPQSSGWILQRSGAKPTQGDGCWRQCCG